MRLKFTFSIKVFGSCANKLVSYPFAILPVTRRFNPEPTLECTGKPYLLKAQHSAFNISDSTTIPLTVQNWQITSFVPDSTNKHSTDKQRNFRVPDSTKSSKKLACAL